MKRKQKHLVKEEPAISFILNQLTLGALMMRKIFMDTTHRTISTRKLVLTVRSAINFVFIISFENLI